MSQLYLERWCVETLFQIVTEDFWCEINMRRALRNAIATGDFVDYYTAAGYADGVQSAIDGLEELLESGYASDVVELSEEAIDLLEDALNSMDDSDGKVE